MNRVSTGIQTRMFRAAILVGTTGLWLTAMSLLIQREYFQLAAIQSPFEILPITSSGTRNEYQNISMDGRWIGFRQTVLRVPDEELAGEDSEHLLRSKDAPFILKHVTYLSFLLLGRENEMMVKGSAGLDSQLYLQNFSYTIKSKDYESRVTGEIKDGKILLSIEDAGYEPSKKEIPAAGPILHSESLGHIWTPKNLHPGKQGRLQIWNPLLLKVEEIEFEVGPRSSVTVDGATVEAQVVTYTNGEIKTRTWINSEGMVLKTESPTGLLMETRPAWEIYDSMRENKNTLADLPNLYSVAPDREIEDPENLTYLKVRLVSGAHDEEIEIRRDDLQGLDQIKWPLQFTDAELLPALQSDSFIQSSEPAIRDQARAIIGEERSLLAAAAKIQAWVHANMIPAPTASVPFAREILDTKKGDCNEYTALFTALARSVGIPTRMTAGLVYYKGRFYYHAWPEIHLGRWVALDPTFNQLPADATHIALVRGGLPEQVDLAAQLGSIQLSILETRANETELKA